MIDYPWVLTEHLLSKDKLSELKTHKHNWVNYSQLINRKKGQTPGLLKTKYLKNWRTNCFPYKSWKWVKSKQTFQYSNPNFLIKNKLNLNSIWKLRLKFDLTNFGSDQILSTNSKVIPNIGSDQFYPKSESEIYLLELLCCLYI